MPYFQCPMAYIFSGVLAAALYLAVMETVYRKRGGRPAPRQRLAVLLFGFYLSVIFSITVSPGYFSPPASWNLAVNLIPFSSLADATRNPLNLWGNIVMFIPFGFLLVLFSRKYHRLSHTLLAGCALSLMIEILQLFSFRSTDIDDVILNTLGTLIGFLLGRLFLYFRPSRRRSKNPDGKARPRPGSRYQGGSVAVLVLLILIAVNISGYAMDSTIDSPEDAHVRNDPVSISVVPEADRAIEAAPELAASNVYLINTTTDAVLYEKASSQRIAPASTAKMLTALTVLDYCDCAEKVTVGQEVQMIGENASRAWLYPGCTLTVRQLLVALLLPSGNDAAYALAVYGGRKICDDSEASIDEALAVFVQAMNEKAAAVGAEDSHFTNADGYDEEGQYTTARDLAGIAEAFTGCEVLSDIASSYRIYDVWLSGQEATYYNTNELLNPDSPYYLEYARGIKTGSSKEAGCCLISDAVISDDLYLLVVMGSTEEGRFTDSLKLYQAIIQ